SVADVTATTSAPGTARRDSRWMELTNCEPTRPTRTVFMIASRVRVCPRVYPVGARWPAPTGSRPRRPPSIRSLTAAASGLESEVWKDGHFPLNRRGEEMPATPTPGPTPPTPPSGDERVELANQLYREFHARCFWHSPPDLVITEDLIPFVMK